MDNFFETAYSCKSVHLFHNKPVEDEVIDQIVSAGNMTPLFNQGIHVMVVTNKDMLEKFEETGKAFMLASGIKSFVENASRPNFRIFDGAPALILISAPHAENPMLEPLNIAIGHGVVENMMLAATALGLGTAYNPAALFAFRAHPELKLRVGIDSTDDVVAAFVLGYSPEAATPAPKQRATNVRYFK